MITLRESQHIRLPDGYSEYAVEGSGEIDVQFEVTGKSEVYLRVLGACSLTVRTAVGQGARVSFLIWNAAEGTVRFNEEHTVQRDGVLRVAYGEVNPADMERSCVIHLAEPGASALVSSASLVSADKTYVISVNSEAPHTEGIMEHYAVVLQGGKYRMDATGKIAKGAKGSNSHQTSRALCFDEKQNSMILPKLLIDENDVQASHATTLGRVDEEHLYYMQSRGLTVRQCTSLISAGYLMPVTQFIEEESLKQTLREELERKLVAL